jgi:hypothetical protein
MHPSLPAAALLISLTGASAVAAPPPMPFDDAVYLTCRDADQMDREKRIAVIRYLADHAADHYGLTFQDEDTVGRELGTMIRAGCTMFPNAYVHFIVAQAVRAEAEKLGTVKK